MKQACLETRKLIGFNIKHTWRWINADASYKPQQVVSAIIYTKPHKNQHKHNNVGPWKENTPIAKTKNPQQPHQKKTKNSNQHTRNLDDQLLSQFSLHETLVELMGLRNCTGVSSKFRAHRGCVLYCLQGSGCGEEIQKCGYQVWSSEEQRIIRMIWELII